MEKHKLIPALAIIIPLAITLPIAVRAIATGISIESIGGGIWEFGLYTGDSKAYSLVHGGLSYFIIGYIVALIIFPIIKLLSGKSKPVAVNPADQTTSPANYPGRVNTLLIVGSGILGIAGWLLLAAEKWEYSTITFLWSVITFVQFALIIYANRWWRRHGVRAATQWIGRLFQLVPTLVIIWWIILLNH